MVRAAPQYIALFKIASQCRVALCHQGPRTPIHRLLQRPSTCAVENIPRSSESLTAMRTYKEKATRRNNDPCVRPGLASSLRN